MYREKNFAIFCCADIQEMAFYHDHGPRLVGIPIYTKQVKI